MKKIWFVMENQVVSGPFTSTEVEEGYRSGHVRPDTHIWWKGQKHWIPVQQWMQELPNIMQALDERLNPRHWYLELNGNEVGPISKKELVEKLKNIKNLYETKIWNTHADKWSHVFEFQDILAELGINRRNYTRAPIMAEVTIIRHEDKFVTSVADIGAGGIGVMGGAPLNEGDEVQLIIKSQFLSSAIRVHAKVVSANEQGNAGFQFVGINMESKAIIMDYIKNFEEEQIKAAQRKAA